MKKFVILSVFLVATVAAFAFSVKGANDREDELLLHSYAHDRDMA